jgi:hypothetical protein
MFTGLKPPDDFTYPVSHNSIVAEIALIALAAVTVAAENELTADPVS